MATTMRGGSGLRFPYQEMQKTEVVAVAKSRSSRRSGARVIARRRCVHGQRDLGEDGFVALEHKKRGNHVWEVRTGVGRVVVQTRERGGVRAYQNRRWTLTAVVARRGLVRVAGGSRVRRKEGKQRGRRGVFVGTEVR
jgi:hypothetical protein